MTYEEVGVSWSHRTFEFEKRYQDGTKESYTVQPTYFTLPFTRVRFHSTISVIGQIMAFQKAHTRS